jgi:mono/diheme cytochrome c family protein
MRKLLSALVLMILVWGCAKKIAPSGSGTSSSPANTQAATTPDGKGKDINNPEPGVSDNATKAPATATDAAIAAGQNTFNAKCGRCHGLKTPGDFTAERWVGIMDAMAPKAHLTDIEKANVYAYVKANAKK